MIRLLKRRLAIRSYVRKLSLELARRFGLNKHYSVDEVTQALARSGLSSAFIAYAHALYCSEAEFNSYYGPLKVACTYAGLRTIVGRRYFGGAIDFDAAGIIRATRPDPLIDGFHESGSGEDAGH